MSATIVRLTSRRFNAAAAPELSQAMARAWATRATTVALDFTDVVYIDSLGISALMAEHRGRPPATRIVLCGLNDFVREVLEITQLVRIFDVYADADALLRATA